MRKQYKPEDELAIRELNKCVSDVLNMLAEPLKMLFEDIYGGECDEEYQEILSKFVLIEQETLPVAEMKYKGIGELE